MVVTLTELAAELRLGDGVTSPAEPVAGILTRLLAVSEAFVDQAAPDCPEAIRDEVLVRMSRISLRRAARRPVRRPLRGCLA